MDLLPAIDVRAGRAVRLRQGDYGDETVYGDDPVAIATAFAAAGASWIHVVDLDAARTGAPVNRPTIAAIATACPGVAIEAGGGVRSLEAADALWRAGVHRVVVGTAAIEDPGLVAALASVRPGGVAVGLDVRSGEVAVRGWTSGSGRRIDDVLSELGATGIAAVVVTDIGRDGMLSGPDLEGLAAVLDQSPVDVIASGGVSGPADVVALGALRGPETGRQIAGVIVGKAIYEGRLSVAEGVSLCAASA